MKYFACDNRSGTSAVLQAQWQLFQWVLVALFSLTLIGCQSKPTQDDEIPLPGFADEGPAKPSGVYAVIRRADVPLNESTDDAWSIINEQLVPPVSRGVWRGNGLRVGLLPRDQLDAYSEVMPQPVGFSRKLINKSAYLTPIIESPKLRSDLRFEVDLTRPPRPRAVEMIQGGKNSTLRLMARIETEADGQHTLVITPQHFIPSPLNLIPRDPYEKDLDGRMYEELTLRITPGKNQIIAVGLHWPWPKGEVIDETDDDRPSPTPVDQVLLSRSIDLPRADPGDPAAPPRHLTPLEDQNTGGDANESTGADPLVAQTEPAEPRFERIATPLATTFGSTLLTGTRIRQPIRTVLLITIEGTEPTPFGPAIGATEPAE